ncbi:response regulator transcription factor [Faecalimonas hominis]
MIQILIIEDDRHIGEGLQFLLESEGYCAELAMSVSEGREKLEKGKTQLLILDVNLPDGSGFEFFQKIQSKKIPVIFLTALNEEKNIVKGFNLGADEYITKPFRPRELVSRVKNVIRLTGIEDSRKQELIIGNVSIHLEEKVAYKNGKQLELTALEYKVLLLFFENRGRILTRNQILSHIWDDSGNFVNDNTLTVYIKRLREKIEDNPYEPDIIKTVRGMGYKIGG